MSKKLLVVSLILAAICFFFLMKNSNDVLATYICPTPTPCTTPTLTPTPIPSSVPSPSLSPEPSVTPTPTLEISPTPEATVNPDICKNIDGVQTGIPEGMHLDASGLNCVNFGQAGPPPAPPYVASGQVLGTSTMAGTGQVTDNIYYSLFTLGALLLSAGIMKNAQAKVKASK